MFYAALGSVGLPALSTLQARLLKRQYVQAWECGTGGFSLYVLPSLNCAPSPEDQGVWALYVQYSGGSSSLKQQG